MRAILVAFSFLVFLLLAPPAHAGDESAFEPSVGMREVVSPWMRTAPGVPRDVLESWTWCNLGGGRRESADLTWKASVRFDLNLRARAADRGALAKPAWGFEVRPWEAWADLALGDAIRVRAGNQFFVRGKLDVASPGAMLGAIDVRQGPSADPDQIRLPVPMVLATWTPSETIVVEVAWEPLFMPDRVDLLGSNYALLSPTASPALYRSLRALEARMPPSALAALVADVTRIGPGGLPGGEAMTRTTWRAGSVDLGASYGWVRQKLPAISVQSSRIDAEYDRYHQVTADAEMAVGAFTFAAEAGLALGKKQYLARETLPLPSIAPPQLAGGLKATWTKSERLAATLETSVIAPTKPPAEGHLLGFGGAPVLGIAAFGIEPRWEKDRLAIHALATTSGPSAAIVARYAHSLTRTIEIGAGAAVFFSGSARGDSIGAMTDRLDQAFVFAEWKP
jgi:hypothetical protein